MSQTIQMKNKKGKVYPNPYMPVGSIYMSVNNTNPNVFFGGKWERIANGRTLVGVDETDNDFKIAKKIGGEKAHTLTVDEMPQHNHTVKLSDGVGSWKNQVPSGNNVNAKETNFMSHIGGTQPHNNLQPYVTVYIWERIA